MKIFRTISAIRKFSVKSSRPVVFVPTMGALHEGHAALIRHARKLAGKKGSVVVSIFVNPTQFGPKEDLRSYPRTPQSDFAICRREGADAIFLPDAEEIYFPDRSLVMEENSLSRTLCGASRPGHFAGVCLVVSKLFLIMGPDIAVFGEKDWQQLAIIRRMVRDLNFNVRIVGHPTVREPDGLAMSSRNAYLTPAEREAAPRIHAALRSAVLAKTPASIEKTARRLIEKIPGARIDYVSLVDAESLQPVRSLRRHVRLASAVFLGKARLIDNIGVFPAQQPRVGKK